MNALHTTALVLAVALTITAAKAATVQTAGSMPRVQAGAVPSAQHPRSGPHALEGVWAEQITIKDCWTGTPFLTGLGQNVVIRGGALVNTNSAAVTESGPGLGQWWYEPPGRHYGQRFRGMTFDPASGELNGFQVTHRELTLSPDGNSTTAEITVERYDAAGTLVGTGCASTVGSRIF
jgi:hypothetical protein